MKISLRKTHPLSADYGKVRRLYNSAFPADERAPIGLLTLKSYKDNVDFWSLYADGGWVGLAYVVNGEDLSYLFYFAVSAEKRGKGIGSKCLKALKNFYSGRRLFLALEQLDETAENYPERLKRREFYLKNGLKPIAGTIREAAVVYDIMGAGGDIQPHEYENMMKKYMGFPLYKLVSMEINEK